MDNQSEYVAMMLDECTKSVAKRCAEICDQGFVTQMTSTGAAQKIREEFGLNDA